MARVGLWNMGLALKQLRVRAGKSQRALAAELGVHQPQVVKAEAGADMLSSRLHGMARALGCELMLVPAAMTGEVAARIAAQEATGATPAAGSFVERPQDAGSSLAVAYAREWPSVDPHVLVIVAHLQRAAQLIEKGMGQLAARHGISFGELLVLGALRRMGAPYESSLSELRRQFWISLPGMSKRIGNLERLGFVERAGNPNDRRGTLVRLTKKAFELQEEDVRNPSREFIAIRAMDAAERLRFSEVLSRLLDIFEDPGSSIKR